MRRMAAADGRAGLDKAKVRHSKLGQVRAGQGRAGQGRAGQGRAGQGRAGQGRAKHRGRLKCSASPISAGESIPCSFATVS